MFATYLRTAWRNLVKNKLYGAINIAGLAIGMTVSFLLLLYVHHEWSYDKFNTNSDRLYLMFKNTPSSGEVKTKPIMPDPLAAVLKKDLPELAYTARTSFPENSLVNYKDKSLKISTIAADSTILDMFTFDFVHGNKQNALSGESTIVLTQSAATSIFGAVNPVGQTIKLNNEFPLTVNAVIRDNPANSSLSFKAMIPWGTFLFQRPWMKEAGWGNYLYPTYVMLKPGADVAGVNAKVKNFLGKYDPSNKDISLFLYPLTRLHLYNEFQNGVNTGGRIEYVRLFLVLAIGILIIACINIMNLSTARSEKRAKEVGVRKTMGARRSSLVQQFMTESILMSIMAFVLSVMLLSLLLPAFAQITNTPISLPFDNLSAWITALGVTLFCGLMAGSYPAFFLSSFNPIRVLKGHLTGAGAAGRPRRLLVLTQFTFATGLILSSIFINGQINYIKDRPVGYDRNNLVEMPLEGKLDTQFETFRREAIQAGAISDAAMTSSAITSNQASTWDVRWPDQLPGEDKIPIDCMAVTWHFTDTYGLKLAAGRDFDPARPGDSTAVMLNEAAVRLMRLHQPLGKEITWQGAKRTIIGVVHDFVWGSPYEPVKPAIIGFVKDWMGNIGLRLNPAMPLSKSLSILQTLYKKYNPAYPLEYTFTDERFSKKYRDEQVLGTISLGFTVLAILISCLGLFGLASFSAEQRRKEMGIRKVLGASAGNLWFKLSREFFQLIMLSFIPGAAISAYYTHQWLAKYTYHAGMKPGAFLLTLLLSLLICLAAVSWQTMKAASANPVDSLKSE
ncbi:ABC transporter permease [Flavitalea sp. BT771]|uniref:ABC transporter permease n=1 Tax=Flavitalea sp. BT771 TaxID=3063329 RepID=UPI0026E120CD|nr:ABC transporter permease [Flavitalea sp. BT771]MDO6429098.1 ABC transporter permease [Flavitalea sp. BT771]MDV6218774.1 FtsX-like permease family protein [Flavitalea sp. BT771]